MHKLFYRIAALLLIAVALGGCTREQPAVKELRVCSSMEDKLTKILVEDYSRRTGTKVKISFLPPGTVKERLDFLRQQKFDCWLGGTAEEYYMADQEKILEPYFPKEAYKVPAELRSGQGQWTSLYLRYIALISNKNNLAALGLYAPETWEELLHPHLLRELAIPDPYMGGASYGMMTSIWQLQGEEHFRNVAKAMAQQEPLYTATVSDAVDLVYSGRRTVAILPLDYALRLEERHSHLYATVVKDANRNMLTGAAVLVHSGNKDKAREFLDYLMSDESEALLRNSGYQYMWHVKHYPYNDGRRRLIGNVQVPVDDLGWTAGYKRDIIKAWMAGK